MIQLVHVDQATGQHTPPHTSRIRRTPMDEEVHTLIDGSITAVKRPGPRGGWEYALGFPADDMRALYDGPHSHVLLVIDENITRRLSRLINTLTGETND